MNHYDFLAVVKQKMIVTVIAENEEEAFDKLVNEEWEDERLVETMEVKGKLCVE